MLVSLALVTFSFWIGAIPFGVLLARRLGVKIQDHGSGNIGATNVTRVLGPIPGAIVLVLDMSKGALAVAAALQLCGWPWTVALSAFAAIAGHCFSPFLRGKGGKGVATAFGAFLVLGPGLALLAVVVFLIVFRLTRVPALGSLAGVAALAVLHVHRGEAPYATLALATTALLIYTHRTNLAKLRAR